MIGSPYKRLVFLHKLLSTEKAVPDSDVPSLNGLLRIGFLKSHAGSYELEQQPNVADHSSDWLSWSS